MTTKNYNNLQGDVWTIEDDSALAGMVIRYAQEGKTSKAAFDDFEKETGGRRTARSAKFRWHKTLREQYSGAYVLAKEEGKKFKKTKAKNQGEAFKEIVEDVLNKNPHEDYEKEITMEDVYILVKKARQQERDKKEDLDSIKKQMNQYKSKYEEANSRNRKLNKELDQYKEAVKEISTTNNELLNAIRVLKKAGIAVGLPDTTENRYLVNRDGTVEKL